jgi:hypothetical protein
MNPMPSHIVENTWKEVGGMKPWQVPELVDKMGKQQSAIIAYILAVDQNIFNQAERELLLYKFVAGSIYSRSSSGLLTP